MNQNQESKNIIIDKLTPVGFRVLLNIYKKPEQTSSGFILPEQENAGMPVLGTITILGKKTLWQKAQILFGFKPRYRIGQQVYFRKYSIDELLVNNGDEQISLYVLEENEIIGIIN